MRRLLIPILLLCLASATLQAASYYYFDHFTTYEGLPSNTIHCTFQDSYGFLWIGTRDGLCRYDSKRDSLVCGPEEHVKIVSVCGMNSLCVILP